MNLVGTTIGHIRIVDTLGKGGMGEVYAGYDEALKRKVAVKVIRAEKRLDAETKARFLREARILSQLDHPGICRIYDLVEDAESDFLVLELVEGRSLKEALKEDLGTTEKLRIAEQVASALGAAHARGVVHRDLKPENVMLTPDGETASGGAASGRVKVLDFGIAHSVDERLAASIEEPRQSDPSTGRRGAPFPTGPVDVPETGEVSLAEPRLTRTAVSSASPGAGPSSSGESGPFVETRLGTVMGTIAYMSPEQARGERATAAGDVYSLGLVFQELFTGRAAYEEGMRPMVHLMKAAAGETRPVTGIDLELAALVTRMKSLAPEGRPSAAETAERLRWIRDRPRRRLLRLAAAAVLAVLFLGTLKYTLDLRRAERRASEARREAEKVSEFLVSLFEVSDPGKALGDTVTARELLDKGAARIAEELRDEPLTQSRVMLTMGRVYRRLGLYEKARPLLEEALDVRRDLLGDEHFGTAAYRDHLASLYHDQGDYEPAEPLFQSALKIREDVLGPEHVTVAASLNNLAFLYRAWGRTEQAEPLFRQALEIQVKALGSKHPDVTRSLNNLGELYRARGEHSRAEPLLLRAAEVQEERFGSDHPEVAVSLNNLAMVYHEQGEAARAEPLYLRTLAIFEKVLGPVHADVATILNNLAELYRVTGDYRRAEPLYQRALAIQEEALGPIHPSIAVTLANLADLYSAKGERTRAETLYRRALRVQEEAHPSVAVTLNHLADLDTRLGRTEEAEALFRRSLASTEQALAEQPESRSAQSRLAATQVGLGKLYQVLGSSEQATEAWDRAVALMEPLTAGSEVVAYAHVHALALLYLGRVDEARPLASRLLAKGWSHPDFLELCREHGLLEKITRG